MVNIDYNYRLLKLYMTFKYGYLVFIKKYLYIIIFFSKTCNSMKRSFMYIPLLYFIIYNIIITITLLVI